MGAGSQYILFDAQAVMLAIVVPTIAIARWYAWWFRKSNPKDATTPASPIPAASSPSSVDPDPHHPAPRQTDLIWMAISSIRVFRSA
ncbi:hypothetical protein GOZ89_24335 [Agrobacterium vitis]|uniref:hypothetical protein n=1 Tax=Agrobacterium vitis TaxID=373 RepID=UPI0012E8818F|nr:hypothetical protein [Agrobacterium vitis]MVA82539.1 hypothetical protein [Agrobacterium vitis]